MTDRTEPHITTPDKLMSVIQALREFLDLLECVASYGDYWIGYDEQKEIAGMECELDMVLVNKSHLEAMLDKWDEWSCRAREAEESIAMSCRTDGVACNINRRGE